MNEGKSHSILMLQLLLKMDMLKLMVLNIIALLLKVGSLKLNGRMEHLLGFPSNYSKNPTLLKLQNMLFHGVLRRSLLLIGGLIILCVEETASSNRYNIEQ